VRIVNRSGLELRRVGGPENGLWLRISFLCLINFWPLSSLDLVVVRFMFTFVLGSNWNKHTLQSY